MKTIYLSIILFFCQNLFVLGQNALPDYIQKMTDDSVKVDSLSNFGSDVQFSNSTLDLQCQQQGFAIAQKNGDKKRMGVTLYRMGVVEIILEKYSEAFDHLQQAYKIFEEQKNYTRLIKTSQKMAQIFADKGDKVSGLGYYQKTLVLAQKYKNEEYEAHAWHGIATLQGRLELNSEAEKSFEKAINLYQKLGFEEYKQNSLFNLTGVYIKQNKYNNALEILENYTKFEEKKGNSFELSMGFAKLGEVYFAKKDYQLAEQNMLKSINNLEKIDGVLKEKVEIYDLLEKTYEAQNENSEAFVIMKKWRVLNDSLTTLNNRKIFATLQTKYETAQKEAQIKDLDQQNEIKRNQLIYAIIGLSVLVILLGLSVFLYRNLQRNKAKVDAQAKQLSTLMKELHHRVKNNLAIVSSLLSLQSSRLEDEKAAKAVMEGQMRVEAMSLIHQRLYKTDDITTLNIKTYLTDLAESLMSAYGYHRDNFDLQITVENPEIDVDLAMPIGLIVNELVTNSFKYAYQNTKNPSLKIDLKNDKEITLKVQDNGIGIDEMTMNKKTDSFGKQLIKAFAKQTKGQYKFENKNGTYFELHIPKIAA
jgi:two-component sensor histidine kinase